MRVALVHDFLTQYGGAERFLESLLKIFENHEITIYTLVFEPAEFPQSWMQYPIRVLARRLPKIDYFPQIYASYLTACMAKLSLSSYDLVFSSDSIFAKMVLCPPPVKHICYQHSPAKMLYPFDVESDSSVKLKSYLSMFQKSFLRIQEYMAIRQIDRLLTNSNTTADRIREYYQRTPEVVYSFVDIPTVEEFNLYYQAQGEYFLCLSRLVPHKRIDLVVDVCSSLNLPLVVVGQGTELSALKKKAGDSVRFTGYVSEKEKLQIIGKCKALVFPGVEDLGLTPLEVMALGKPVIAFRAGGVCETVVESETGLFFNEQTHHGLQKVISDFENYNFSPEMCRKRASLFSRTVYETKIKSIVDEVMSSR